MTGPENNPFSGRLPVPGPGFPGVPSLRDPGCMGEPQTGGLHPAHAALPIPDAARYNDVMTHEELEEGTVLKLDWDKLASVAANDCRVVPVAVQDSQTGELILVAYVNEQALARTRETGKAVFWSTSRNELWEKGLTSGNGYLIKEIRVNCEQNSLLYIVRPEKGKICHTRNRKGEARNCYYRRLDLNTGELENLDP